MKDNKISHRTSIWNEQKQYVKPTVNTLTAHTVLCKSKHSDQCTKMTIAAHALQ